MMSRVCLMHKVNFERAILHVDMDAFYAAVEVLDEPSLRGRPVVVGGTPEGRGVVAAASYEARAYGVFSAMSAAKAVKLCPTGVFLRPRMERYAEISRQMFAILHSYTPLVEPLSIDEGFLDVSGCDRLFGGPEHIGRLIKDRIADELGLVASVGVAPNKFLAKLASDLEKPDGFVVIHAATAEEVLVDLPVSRIWGVGRTAEAKLKQLGITRVRDLLAFPVADLVRELGEHAVQWRELARGRDSRPVVPARAAKSIGNETTFGANIADAHQLDQILQQLCDKVAWRLRAANLVAGTLTLKARYADFTTHTRSVTLAEPTDSEVEIRRRARILLGDNLGRKGRPLRLVGLTASRLSPHSAALFVDPARERQRELDRVMDEVRGKYGQKLHRGHRKP